MGIVLGQMGNDASLLGITEARGKAISFAPVEKSVRLFEVDTAFTSIVQGSSAITGISNLPTLKHLCIRSDLFLFVKTVELVRDIRI